MKVKNFNKMIQILKASFEDAGEYVCTAENKLGYIEHTITVQVKGENVSSRSASVFLHGGVEETNVPAFDSGSILVGEAQ